MVCDVTALGPLTSNRSWPSNVHRSCRLHCCRPPIWSNAFRAPESQLHAGEKTMGTEDATNQQVKPSSKSSTNSPISLPPPLPCKPISGWTGATQSWPSSKMQFVEGSSSVDSHKIICPHRMNQCIDSFEFFSYLLFSPCREFWGRWRRPSN